MSVPNSGMCESSTNHYDPESLVRDYGPMVSSLCRRMIEDRERARDAAQEVWIEVLKSLPGFRGKARLSTWITVIARRTINHWMAKEIQRDFRSFGKGCRITVNPPIEELGRNDPEWLDLWTRMICDLCLTAILHCLEPETRFLFILRAVLKMEYDEISAIMDMDGPATRKRFSRACRKLSRFGKEECVLLNPSGKCRCGQKKFMAETKLAEEFAKLRTTVNQLETWFLAETFFSPVNFWNHMNKDQIK
mgnify:CR=1 FL=1